MKLQAEQKAVQEIFFGKARYVIPDYQRNYAWKADQIDAFLEDLKTAWQNDEDHFFGSLVLLQENENKFQVIDGQQRITTFVLLICLIRDRISQLQDKNITKNGQIVSLESLVKDLLLTAFDFDWRYEPNYKIRDVFRSHVLLHPDDAHRKVLTSTGKGLNSDQKRATGELRRAYSRMSDWLTKQLLPVAGNEDEIKRRLYGLIETIMSGAKILRIVVANEDDAFILFETLNDRGLRLTPSDLLKSFTLRQIGDGQPEAVYVDALERWDDAAELLGDFPFTKFLRHYLLSTHDKPVQAKKIFDMFKKRIETYNKEGSNGALRNLEELTKAAEVYARLLPQGKTGDGKLDIIVQRLNLISETHRVFLIRLLSFTYPIEQVRKAARALEALAFRWVLTGGNAQVLEGHFQTAAGLLSEAPNSIADATKALLAEIPTDDAVRNQILQWPARKDSRFQFYVLQRLNSALTLTDNHNDQKLVHVEHLAPQKPLLDAGWYDAVAPKESDDPEVSIYEDYLWQWGNLTLLEFEINTSIGNADWLTKRQGKPDKPGLVNSQIGINETIKVKDSWTHRDITERTMWIADQITKITSVPNLDSSVQIPPYSN